MNKEKSADGDDQAIVEPLVLAESPTRVAKKRVTAANVNSGNHANAHGTTPSKRRDRKKKKTVTPQEQFIKYAALALLVTQTVGLVLLMRYSRTQHSTSTKEEHLYLPSTAVFFNELLKLFICTTVALLQFQWNVSQTIKAVWVPTELLKLAVPSILYTIQNNLLYAALTFLDAATYQVCYQLKILTTALFSAVLLQRRFSQQKWIALVLLTVGVIIVQLTGKDDDQHHHHHAEDSLAQHHDGSPKGAGTDHSRRLWGMIAVICAACTSGFSGVYFEKILKESTTSLWIRNIQMGMSSVVVAYLTSLAKDGTAIQQYGFMGGYNTTVWIVIAVQALGGLIVATVVKYADNVLKVFAASFSIVLSCIVSALFFDFHPTGSFVVGASIVVGATVLYSMPERRRKRKTVLPLTR